jgi:hypothetical protein
VTPEHKEAGEIARGLTMAQRAMVLESEPGAWGRDDDGCGAEVHGAGKWAVARALEKLGLGDTEESPGSYPSGLYFNNPLGLQVRAILQNEAQHDG